MRRRRLPRPWIQRAFLRWLEEASARLAVPILLGRRTDRSWGLAFGGGTTPALSGALWRHQLLIYADWEGTSWDLVLCLEVAVRRTSAGYVDLWVRPEYREPYPTREALWREEVFEPFLRWVNETLAPALFLGVWRTEKEATWAKLLGPKDMAHPDVPRAYALLPARDEAGNSVDVS